VVNVTGSNRCIHLKSKRMSELKCWGCLPRDILGSNVTSMAGVPGEAGEMLRRQQ